jgi:hypothetical protein
LIGRRVVILLRGRSIVFVEDDLLDVLLHLLLALLLAQSQVDDLFSFGFVIYGDLLLFVGPL